MTYTNFAGYDLWWMCDQVQVKSPVHASSKQVPEWHVISLCSSPNYDRVVFIPKYKQALLVPESSQETVLTNLTKRWSKLRKQGGKLKEKTEWI